MAKQKIDIQTTLMRFVDDYGLVFPQIAIALGLSQQNPVGHEFDEGLLIGLIGKANLAANLTTERDAEFLGNPPRNRQRRHAPWLRTADSAIDTESSFKAHL